MIGFIAATGLQSQDRRTTRDFRNWPPHFVHGCHVERPRSVNAGE